MHTPLFTLSAGRLQGSQGEVANMLLIRLHDLLEDVRTRAGPTFTGIGVIVATDLKSLPIAPLRADSRPDFGRSLAETLAEISLPASDLHDGFHVLSPEFELELVSQYFGPPVHCVPTLRPDRRSGARYMAALLGSALPGVLATGVATLGQGVTIFRDGLEAKRSR
ncbi:MAG: hypothetical protein JWO15_262 [Sphingomonadales bacterium]|nr:hypothetical protein [Sphingomonadales bacterium]